MSFPPNPKFDKFIYKSSDLRTKEPSKEQFLQVDNTGKFQTFVNTYLYKVVGNKYELLGDKKIVIQETDEVVITNKNGKIVKVITDPVNSSEEQETIQVVENGEAVVKTFTTLYYSYESKVNPESLCQNLIDVTKEFYLNKSLPSVFNFSKNTDRLFTEQVLKTPFNGNNQWFGVSRIRSTSSPEVIVQIGTDGTILDVFECPLPTEEKTDIRELTINFTSDENVIPAPVAEDPGTLPPEVDDPGPPTVSATFDTRGGTPLIPAQSGPSPLYVSEPSSPSKAGNNFNGFSPTLPAVITEDTVFTAIFTPIPPDIGEPDIVTSFASSIKADSAVIGGNIINAGGGVIDSRGSVFREILAEVSGSTVNDIQAELTSKKIVPEANQGVRTSTGAIFVFDGTTWILNPDNRLDIIFNGGITSDGEGLGVFVSELEGLNSGREYIHKAYATNTDKDGEEQDAYGELRSFTTRPLTIDTAVPFDIGLRSAKSGGLITNTGNLTILSRGLLLFEGNTTEANLTLRKALDDPQSNITVIPDTGDLGNSLFRLELLNLKPNTKYSVRAYATNARGIGEGGIKPFDTDPAVEPTITIFGNITKTASTITVQANLTDIGDGPVTQRGILVLEDNSGTPTFSNTDLFTTEGPGNLGLFPTTRTGLKPNTDHRVVAYATNEFGTGFSSVIDVKTNSADPPIVVLYSASATREQSIRTFGEVVSDGGAGIVERGFRFVNNNTTTTTQVLTTPGLGLFNALGSFLGSTGDTVDVTAFAKNSANIEGESDIIAVTLIE